MVASSSSRGSASLWPFGRGMSTIPVTKIPNDLITDQVQVCISTTGKLLEPSERACLTAFVKLSLTIKKDLHLSQTDVANSNIVALAAT